MSLLRIVSLGLAAAVLCACGQPAEEADADEPAPARVEAFEWKIATTWPKNLPGMGTGVERLAELVEAMSGG